MGRWAAGGREDANRRIGWAVLAGAALLCGGALVLGPTLAAERRPSTATETVNVEVFTSDEPTNVRPADAGASPAGVLTCCREHSSYTAGRTTIECIPFSEVFLAAD